MACKIVQDILQAPGKDGSRLQPLVAVESSKASTAKTILSRLPLDKKSRTNHK